MNNAKGDRAKRLPLSKHVNLPAPKVLGTANGLMCCYIFFWYLFYEEIYKLNFEAKTCFLNFLSIVKFQCGYQKVSFKSHIDFLSYLIIRLTSRVSVDIGF